MKKQIHVISLSIILTVVAIVVVPWCIRPFLGQGKIWFDRRVFGNILAPIARSAFSENKNFQSEKAFDYVEPKYLELCEVEKNFYKPIVLSRKSEVWVIMFTKENSAPRKWGPSIRGYMLVLEASSRPKKFMLVPGLLEPRNQRK